MFIEVLDNTKALCAFERNITFKIEIPFKHKYKYILNHDHGQEIVYGERLEEKSFNLPGGQCEGVPYKLTGKAIISLSTTSDGERCVLTSQENDDGVFIGPIISFEYYLKPFTNSSDFARYFIKVVSENGAKITEKASFWRFPTEQLSENCRETNDLYSFYVYELITNSQDDSLEFWNWEPVEGTLEQDLIQCPSRQSSLISIYDCQDILLFEKNLENVKIIKEETGFTDPIYLSTPLWYITYGAFRKQEIIEDGITKKCVILWASHPLNNNPILDINVPLLQPPIFNYQFIPKNWELLGKFCSPECSTRYPRLSYSCNCQELCPPNTVCSIQKGDQILCLNKDGCIIESVDAGCIVPDSIC